LVNHFAVTEKSIKDKLGTYEIKTSGAVTPETYKIKISVDGIKDPSDDIPFQVVNPPQINSISIKGLQAVSTTAGITNATVANYWAQADDGKLLDNNQVS
jgi:hypothetical protein